MGHQTATTLELPHFKDPHQRMGLILLMMYLSQVGMGLFIHFIKLPFLNFLSIRGRPLQNYVHALLGLIIFAIAASQVSLVRFEAKNSANIMFYRATGTFGIGNGMAVCPWRIACGP